MDRTFTCQGTSLTRLWHCFGNRQHHASRQVVEGLLGASGTSVIPINTHELTSARGADAMQLGFGGVWWPEFAASHPAGERRWMLNINHQTTAEAAFGKTKRAFELTGERLIKLEVLNPDLRTSNDAELIRAVELLQAWSPELVIMPLLSASLETAETLVEMGIPLLRVMGSPIGAGDGIADGAAFARICELPVPVVLDGGVGDVDHAIQAVEMGAAGVLVNSMLFEQPQDPVSVMRDFADRFHAALERMEEPAPADAQPA